jgi:hypothetical protein
MNKFTPNEVPLRIVFSTEMAILATISITTLFIVFSLVIPNTLRSRESEMKRLLEGAGGLHK